MNNCNNDRVFIVSKEKSKQFLEDSKKNVISPEFLRKCLYAYRLLNKKNEQEEIMSGLTPKKKEELKQMMGKYSGKVCLSLLSMEECEHDFMRMQYADEEYQAKLECEVANDDQIPYEVKRIIQQMEEDISDDDFYDLLG